MTLASSEERPGRVHRTAPTVIPAPSGYSPKVEKPWPRIICFLCLLQLQVSIFFLLKVPNTQQTDTYTHHRQAAHTEFLSSL